MEDMPRDSSQSESGSSTTWWSSDIAEKLQSVSLVPRGQASSIRESTCNARDSELSSQIASEVLWSTGTLSSPVPNGFYSIIPDKSLKERFNTIPSLDDLHSLGMEGLKAEIILVDAEKDKKLSMLKQLSTALVKGLNSNPATLIKKIACLVSDFYKRPSSQQSPARATMDEITYLMENRGVQLLGQIKHGSCRPRAILFKVLADAVGLESKLMVGLPSDGTVHYTDSYKHMSVVVVLNYVELLVDLMRFPGQLIPYSSKAIFMSHISAAGESDSAENDSCDSPLEPNSPLWGFSDRIDGDGQEPDENLQSLYQRRVEASSNVPGPSLRNIILRPASFTNGNLGSSHSEPNIATAFWRRSRTKTVADQERTASSSPEYPLSRARGRSMLSGDRHTFREYADGVAASSVSVDACVYEETLEPELALLSNGGISLGSLAGKIKSEGASTSNVRRMRRSSISITPEIGDDIVRAVRAMNETLKQNRLLREQGDDGPGNVKANMNDSPNHASSTYSTTRKQMNQKAMSLPSSPVEFRGQTSQRSGVSDFFRSDNLMSTWNKVLQSSSSVNRPLLPFQEWNIDFSELTVGTRVGIGFFGEVFRGIWNGTDVAIKVFLEQDLTPENMEDFCNEISILSRLRHPNVILFLGACIKPPHLSMVTEYMEMGSLYYLIHSGLQQRKLSWRRRLKMLRDICRGLMCIHRMKIVHRDLKSANCLVNKHWTVKICDFGLSRVAEAPMSDNSSAGTPEWMAPELIRNEPFTEKCDIFSLGVIMWELCTLGRPWEGVSPVQVIYAVANEGSRLEIPEGPLGKLIADCWAEPNERPSCQEIFSRLLDCE